MKYDAFISYSHSDCGPIAPAIQSAIENIGKPWYRLKRNLNVFRDETNLGANPNLWGNIENAIENSENFILLASTEASQSKWIPDEIEKWIEKDPTLQKLFIVKTVGNLNWDKRKKDFNWEETDCLPNILKGKFIDEPLWIDLSEFVNQNNLPLDYKSIGFTNRIAKIISGIIKIDPREILSDELKRNRNIKTFLIITTIIFLILSAFSIFQWIDAINQKKIAISEKVKAEISEKRAILNLKKFKIEEFEKNLRNGRIYLEADEIGLAKQVFLKADSTAKDSIFNRNINSSKIRYLDSSLTFIKNMRK